VAPQVVVVLPVEEVLVDYQHLQEEQKTQMGDRRTYNTNNF